MLVTFGGEERDFGGGKLPPCPPPSKYNPACSVYFFGEEVMAANTVSSLDPVKMRRLREIILAKLAAG